MKHDPIKRRPAARGFTLVELLTVIVIIGLLLGILIPTIKGVISATYSTKSMVRIKNISDATETYFNTNRFYPGQDLIDNTGNIPAASLPGSALLASYLLRDSDGNFGSAATKATYLTYSADLVTTPGATPSALVDCFPVPFPICYYVSRGKGLPSASQYLFADNSGLTPAATSPQIAGQCASGYNWGTYIQNPSFSVNGADIAYNDGAYLLIAPGVDRLYFNADDNTWPGR